MRPHAAPVLVLFLVCLAFSVPATATMQDREEPTIEEARELLERQDFAAAVKAFRAIVEREPENARAWFLLGYALHVGGRLEEALEAHVRAASFERMRRSAAYNAACACALLGRPDDAFGWLDQAVAAGFRDRRLLKTDPDLDSLRDDPRFAALLPPPKQEELFRGEVRVLRCFVGEAAGDQFGWRGRNAGDVDGDGRYDVVVSAPYKKLDGPNAGRIYVYSGATGRLLFQRSGEPGEHLGIGVESAGDVDRDGRADVIAGASRGGYGAGRAYVFSGRDGATLLQLSADEPGDEFGWDVAGVGDLDGDGHGDLAVGAPGSDESASDAGRVYLYSGREGRLLLTLDGEEEGDAFGGSVAGSSAGGRRLLAVGAGNAGPANRGRVYVFELARGEATPHFTIEADETGANLGRMFLSLVGDVDADGQTDVYASDWENAAHGRSTGRAYVHSGSTGERLLTLTGEHAGDGFGIGPGIAGDVNGDGHDDLVVGAWQCREGGPSAGKVYLFSGADGSPLHEYVCAAPGETFGFDAVGLGDVDGDGGIDFLITSAWSAACGPKSGRAFVVAGPTPTWTVEAAADRE